MDTPFHDIPVRSARNRLIDLLGIGDTFPLTDLNVVADQLKVPFDGIAKIPIENAQAGVTYQLCDPKGQPLGDQFKADGNDATLVIESPSVKEDVTYCILATKKPLAGSALPPQAPRFLDERAPVKVGLDTGLAIEILQAPLLDPANAHPLPSDPRIVPFGASVDIRVNNSQEGVQYSLMIDGQDLKDVVRTGDLSGIVLPTGPMDEDVLIQVRATKTFLASDNRAPETKPLDGMLYLKVMADPALAVAVAGAPIVDYMQVASVKIAGTQKSAKYRAYLRAIPDADFVHGDATGVEIVTVPVSGRPDVQVRTPPRPDIWATPNGYAPFGDAALPGTGGDIQIATQALPDDSIVIVQASKEHRVDVNNSASPIIASSIRLNQSAVTLVRPDPARALTLRVSAIGTQTGNTMKVSNGQPGVFYYLRLTSATTEFPLPAYFHKHDSQDPSQNKGVGQLGIEIDLVVAADPEVSPVDGVNRAMAYPRDPLLAMSAFAMGESVSARAVKAQTLVEAKLAQPFEIPAVPAIRAEQPVIDYGTGAKIVIPTSDPLDRYELTQGGVRIKEPVAGNQTDLSFVTDPLTADASFEVVVRRAADSGEHVERVVSVPVTVRPNPALPVAASQAQVAPGGATEIVVQSSQRGVNYQLMSAQNSIGLAVSGTGSAIALPTGAIAADTTFTVSASRADDPQKKVLLSASATVTVKAGS